MSARETARGSILVRRAAKDGKEGIPGLIWRGPTRWEIGKEYRNDINITSTADGFRIVDVVTDVDIALEGTDTFNAFICRRNHTSSAQHPLVEGPDWTKMNSLKPTAMSLLLASRILAKYINVENLAADSTFTNKLIANTAYLEDLAGARAFINALTVKSLRTDSGKVTINNDGSITARDVKLTGEVNADSGKIAGFKISGNGMSNDPFNNDAYIIFRNDAQGAFAGIGGNILPASSGARAVARFENKDTQDLWSLGTNYAALLAAQGARDNVAVQIDGGAISGLNLKNRIISTSGITLTRFDLNAIFINESDITVYLPTMQLHDDGHVIRFKRLSSGKVNIYTSYCYTYDGLSSRYSRPALIYDDGQVIQDWTALTIQSKMDSFELVWVRDITYTVGSTTTHGAWVQYKFPRDW